MVDVDSVVEQMLASCRVSAPHGANPLLFPPWRTSPLGTAVPKLSQDPRHAGHHDTGKHVGKLLRIQDAYNITVTARMGSPVHVTPEPFPLPLDGILNVAARVWLGLTGRQSRVSVPLPLSATSPSNSWVWAASCPLFEGEMSESTTFWHRRQDHEMLSDMSGKVLKPPSSNGRYRGMRMPIPLLAPTHLTWRCVGDPEWVKKLLDIIQYIGPDKGQGYGRIAEWTVESHGKPMGLKPYDPYDPATHSKRDDRYDWAVWDGQRIIRPIPVRHAELIGASNVTERKGSYRPPYYHDEGFNAAAGVICGPDTTR
jgi:hypothetical protein